MRQCSRPPVIASSQREASSQSFQPEPPAWHQPDRVPASGVPDPRKAGKQDCLSGRTVHLRPAGRSAERSGRRGRRSAAIATAVRLQRPRPQRSAAPPRVQPRPQHLRCLAQSERLHLDKDKKDEAGHGGHCPLRAGPGGARRSLAGSSGVKRGRALSARSRVQQAGQALVAAVGRRGGADRRLLACQVASVAEGAPLSRRLGALWPSL